MAPLSIEVLDAVGGAVEAADRGDATEGNRLAKEAGAKAERVVTLLGTASAGADKERLIDPIRVIAIFGGQVASLFLFGSDQAGSVPDPEALANVRVGLSQFRGQVPRLVEAYEDLDLGDCWPRT